MAIRAFKALYNGLTPLVKPLGDCVYHAAQKTTSKIAGPIIDGLADSVASAAGTKIQRHIHQVFVPIPKELTALAKGVMDFIGGERSKESAQTLLDVYRDNGLLQSDEGALQQKFEHLKEEDASLITDVRQNLQDIVAEDLEITGFDEPLRELATLCMNYGSHVEHPPVQTLMISETDKALNADVPEVVTQALEGLSRLLSLQGAISPEQQPIAVERMTTSLYAFFRDTTCASKLTEDQKRKILLLVRDALQSKIYSNQLLQEVYSIVKAVHDSYPIGLIPKTIRSTRRVLVNEFNEVGKSVFGSFFPGTSQALENSSSPAQEGSSSSIFSIVEQGQGWFNHFMKDGKNAVSEQAMRTLATVFHHCFTFIRDKHHTHADHHRQSIIRKLQPSIEALDRIEKQGGDWSSITAVLMDCFNSFQQEDVLIYLQGVCVPLNPQYSSSPVPDMLSIARLHKQRPACQPKSITPQMIDSKASEFEVRSAAYAPMQIVAMVFGIPLTDQRCSELLRIDPSRDLAEHPAIIRDRFFRDIDNAQVNTIYKWGAKCAYILLQAVSSVLIHSILDAVKTDILKWITEPLDTKADDILQFLANLFAILSGAYTSVARTPPEQEKYILNLLKAAVNDPRRYKGLTPEQLYGDVVTAAVKLVHVDWTRTICSHFNMSQISSGSPFAFLNPVIDVVHFIFQKTLQVILFVPEIITNLCLQKTVTFFILSNIQVHTRVQNQTDKLGNPLNATAFTLNEYFLTKLQQIVVSTRMRLNQMDDDWGDLPTPNQQFIIGTIITSILEVLTKSRKLTVEQLRQHDLSDRTFFEELERTALRHILPMVNLSVSTTIWTTLQESLSERSLHEFIYHTFRILSESFDPQPRVTKPQFQAVDKAIGDLIDELIDAMIKRSLDDSWDLKNARQQLEIGKFITNLKRQTREFIANIKRCHAILNTPTASSQAKRTAIQEMNALVDQFLIDQSNALQKAGVNYYLKNGTISHLNKVVTELTRVIRTHSQQILEMTAFQTVINTNEVAANAFLEARNALNLLQYHLCRSELKPENCEQAALHAGTLANHINTLRSIPSRDTQTLISLHNQLKTKHAQVMSTLESISHFQTIMLQWNAFLALKTDPERSLLRTTQAYTRLLSHINDLPDRRDLLVHLSIALNHEDRESLQRASQRFARSLQELVSGMQRSLQQRRSEFASLKERMDYYFGREGLARHEIIETQENLTRKSVDLGRSIIELETWEGRVKEPILVNIDFFNFMDWARQEIHSLSVWQAKQIVAELRAAMIQPHFYLCMSNLFSEQFKDFYK